MKPLTALLTLIPIIALAQSYLPEPTLLAAQTRSNQLCLAVGCGTGGTDYLLGVGSFTLPQNGAEAYLIVPESGPYALPMTDNIGTAALTPSETASLLTSAQVSPALAVQTPNQTASVGQPWSFTLPAGTFTDPRGETMTYDDEAGGAPWLTLSPSGVFSGTPTAAGSWQIIVTATDETKFTNTETFTINAQ